jgi:hypothetical protein
MSGQNFVEVAESELEKRQLARLRIRADRIVPSDEDDGRISSPGDVVAPPGRLGRSGYSDGEERQRTLPHTEQRAGRTELLF